MLKDLLDKNPTTPWFFIMEDDAIPVDNFMHKLRVLMSRVPHDADLIYLGFCETYYKYGEIERLNEIVSIPRGSNMGAFWGQHAVIMNRKAMAAFLCFSMPMKAEIDTLFGLMSTTRGNLAHMGIDIPRNFLRAYCSTTPLVRQESEWYSREDALTKNKPTQTIFNTSTLR